MAKAKPIALVSTLPTGWYPIVGGPRDGQEYYASSEPRPNKQVFLSLTVDPTSTTEYYFDETATKVVWRPK
jgi:hypothetical protein